MLHSASEKAVDQKGVSSFRADVTSPRTERNCVLVTGGGEQLEVDDQANHHDSQRHHSANRLCEDRLFPYESTAIGSDSHMCTQRQAHLVIHSRLFGQIVAIGIANLSLCVKIALSAVNSIVVDEISGRRTTTEMATQI